MVNELLIQMQSFTEPGSGRGARQVPRLAERVPPDELAVQDARARVPQPPADRGDEPRRCPRSGAPAPGRFDRRPYFDLPTQGEREDLIDYFLGRKKYHEQLNDAEAERGSRTSARADTATIEHLFDEASLVASRDGRRG